MERLCSQALAPWVRAALSHSKALTGVSTLFISVKLFGGGQDPRFTERTIPAKFALGLPPWTLDMRQQQELLQPTWI